VPLLPWMKLTKVAWTGRRLAAVAACGLVGIVGYNVPMTLGIQHVQAGLAGILLATEPLWIALLSVVFLKQRLTRPLALGLAVAFLGVVTLSIGGGIAVDPSMLAGASLVLLAAFMWGVYSVAVGPLVRRFGALRISAVTLWIGTVPLVAFAFRAMFTAGHALTPMGWLVLALYGLGPNLTGILLWNYGLSRVPSTKAGLMLNLYPVVSVIGGITFLDERLNVVTLIGGAIIICGLFVTESRSGARSTEGKNSRA
jgi:drug/metabolite transporter (DMT)-like permease